ncbi:LysE/ArgO family amino acid transporter [Bacillus litorisediminis]|uniref:LysE/ArgO family amino acid transporter n=1 Tax=Bacillus litorisediminis TaxID=2922713 RepID=UPI001FAF593C|nr:LysE/ArgO family amino acid transporter [Bacillus litorisediminis]
MEAILHGFILALGLILPLGVQNVFIFNQGATQTRFSHALPAIITASICDTILITLAVTGVSVIVLSFKILQNLLWVAGFFFLAYMGWVMWRTSPELKGEQQDNRFSGMRQITFAASVSLLNPHAIMDTIGVIGTSSLAYAGAQKWVFTMACIVVSWIWFFSLAIAGRKVGKLASGGMLLKRLNQLSAIIIWGMAVYMAYQLISVYFQQV